MSIGGPTKIEENLYLGDMMDARTFGDGLVVCVLEEIPSGEPMNATWIPIVSYAKTSAPGVSVPEVDIKQLDAVYSVVEAALQGGRRVLVHCGAGIERSPLATAWYLSKKKGISMNDAYEDIISKRPQVQRRDIWIKGEPAAQAAEVFKDKWNEKETLITETVDDKLTPPPAESVFGPQGEVNIDESKTKTTVTEMTTAQLQEQPRDLLNESLDKNTTLRAASAMQFMQWVMKKINDASLKSAHSGTSELAQMANFYPGRFMTDDAKLEILNKMKRAGINV